MEAVVAAVDHTKVFEPVPPEADAVAAPFVCPLHPMFVPVIEAVTAVGSETVAVDVSVQPLASVTVTVYESAVSPVIIDDVDPVLHEKVYDGVPPEPKALAIPLLPPLHEVLFEDVKADNADGSEIEIVSKSLHPLLSVTVTVYKPAVNPLTVAELPPVLQEYVYGVAVPDPVAVIAPLLPPLQFTFVALNDMVGKSFTVIVSVSVAVPHAFVNVYVNVNEPDPETLGSKILDETPVPENAPPDGVP